VTRTRGGHDLRDPLVSQTLNDLFGPNRSGTGATRRVFFAVPDSQMPRMLVRVGAPFNGRESPAVRLVLARSSGSLARRAAVLAGLAVRLGSVLPGRSVVWSSMSDGPLLSWLGEELGEQVDVAAIRLGPERPNRKPVVQVTRTDGTASCWVKVAHNPLTVRLLEREAMALEALEPLAEVLYLPRVVATRDWGSGAALATAPLPDPDTARVPRETLISVVRDVHGTAKLAPVEAEAKPLTELVANPRLGGLTRLAAEVQAQQDRLQPGAWHGDLHSGNLAMAPDGRAVLWDWERWESGVPLGADLLHHDLQADRAAGTPLRSVAEGLVRTASERLSELDVPAAAAELVVRDYLIRLAARYAADNPHPAQGGPGDVEEWLVPALHSTTTRS
jgi:hypothetical protein